VAPAGGTARGGGRAAKPGLEGQASAPGIPPARRASGRAGSPSCAARPGSARPRRACRRRPWRRRLSARPARPRRPLPARPRRGDFSPRGRAR